MLGRGFTSTPSPRSSVVLDALPFCPRYKAFG